MMEIGSTINDKDMEFKYINLVIDMKVNGMLMSAVAKEYSTKDLIVIKAFGNMIKETAKATNILRVINLKGYGVMMIFKLVE